MVIVGHPGLAQAAVLRQGQDDMAVIDAGVPVQLLQLRTLARTQAAELGYLQRELGLRIPVRGEGGPHGHDPGHCSRPNTRTVISGLCIPARD
jgi:hypothetical protein